MNDAGSFKDFLATQAPTIAIDGFVANLTLAFILAMILRWVYIATGQTRSNRAMFSRNFVWITMTTMMIIAVVKSSLALSLGLVGALSIVRFRTAIKDPEELAFLFMSITVGLGLGADQRKITLVGFAVMIGAILVIYRRTRADAAGKSMHLTLFRPGADGISVDKVSEALRKHCTSLDFIRLERAADHCEASFLLELNDSSKLSKIGEEIGTLGKDVQFTLLERRDPNLAV